MRSEIRFEYQHNANSSPPAFRSPGSVQVGSLNLKATGVRMPVFNISIAPPDGHGTNSRDRNSQSLVHRRYKFPVARRGRAVMCRKNGKEPAGTQEEYQVCASLHSIAV